MSGEQGSYVAEGFIAEADLFAGPVEIMVEGARDGFGLFVDLAQHVMGEDARGRMRRHCRTFLSSLSTMIAHQADWAGTRLRACD